MHSFENWGVSHIYSSVLAGHIPSCDVVRPIVRKQEYFTDYKKLYDLIKSYVFAINWLGARLT